MTIGYHKCIQILTSIAATMTDVVFLLVPVNTYPGTSYADIHLANASFSGPINTDEKY